MAAQLPVNLAQFHIVKNSLVRKGVKPSRGQVVNFSSHQSLLKYLPEPELDPVLYLSAAVLRFFPIFHMRLSSSGSYWREAVLDW